MAIQDGAKFASPLELIQYYTKKVDGLLTTLTSPCVRRPGQPPAGYRFITHEEMQLAMREAALLLGYQVYIHCTCRYRNYKGTTTGNCARNCEYISVYHIIASNFRGVLIILFDSAVMKFSTNYCYES